MFAALGEDFLLVELDPRGNHPPLLPFGQTFSFIATRLIVPANHLDAIVFHRVSPPIEALGWPFCG